MYTAKFDKLSGKADATLWVSHVDVTLEAIIHDTPVSHGAIPAPDQFGGRGMVIGMQPILLHL